MQRAGVDKIERGAREEMTQHFVPSEVVDRRHVGDESGTGGEAEPTNEGLCEQRLSLSDMKTDDHELETFCSPTSHTLPRPGVFSNGSAYLVKICRPALD